MTQHLHWGPEHYVARHAAADAAYPNSFLHLHVVQPGILWLLDGVYRLCPIYIGFECHCHVDMGENESAITRFGSGLDQGAILSGAQTDCCSSGRDVTVIALRQLHVISEPGKFEPHGLGCTSGG